LKASAGAVSASRLRIRLHQPAFGCRGLGRCRTDMTHIRQKRSQGLGTIRCRANEPPRFRNQSAIERIWHLIDTRGVRDKCLCCARLRQPTFHFRLRACLRRGTTGYEPVSAERQQLMSPSTQRENRIRDRLRRETRGYEPVSACLYLASGVRPRSSE
jgi:hypothetical protein